MHKMLLLLIFPFLIYSCSENKLENKGFSVSRSTHPEQKKDGLETDSLQFLTRPRNVLLTGNAEHRLTPVFKVNYNKRSGQPFTGSVSYYSNYWSYGQSEGNNWNNNFMPGFEVVYGYNFVNISHFNHKDQTRNDFFEQAVLIKNLYYPTFSKDTLNYEAVSRDYYLVSVYDDDTNDDGFINMQDLRRFYHFDINAENKKPLVPNNYSVISSEYDPANDFVYVFARLDKNSNGQMEDKENIHVFWIDLKNPDKKGRLY